MSKLEWARKNIAEIGLVTIIVCLLIGWTAQEVGKFTAVDLTATTNAFAAGASQVVEYPMVFDDDGAGNCVAITTSSAQKTLPTASDIFTLCAYGNEAYVLCGSNPTATTTVTTGYSVRVKDGQCLGPFEIESAKCAVIGTSEVGALCFLNHTSPGGRH